MATGPEDLGSEEVLEMMFWYGSHWVFWQAALMWIGTIAFWGLIVWAIWALIDNLSRKSEDERRGDDALRILDRRLAKGEIDPDEYRRLRELLAHDDRTPVGTRVGR